ncbi:expressed conserved protein [Echinococcus multilocularis]|uniref:Expressed conserved protein n=1 Tax=Echinococcus multilocularis TaxID=6211 RepID=A0A068XW50_ECHMU|nr:expressed conserved protein [Echinococcus multilocularis]
MLLKSTTVRVRCVLYSQVVFSVSLTLMGLLLVIVSAVSVRNLYWMCPVLNLYYSVSWLTLALGIVQVLLGCIIAILLYFQPRCAKQDNLVLIGPEGNPLGEIAESPGHSVSTQYWTLRLSSNHVNSHGCCRWRSRFCCCFYSGNQSMVSSITAWFRPMAILFLLIIVAHMAAIPLTISFISQAQDHESGLLTEVENIFVEAKPYFLHSTLLIASSSAAKCWYFMESSRHCCGSVGAADWLRDYPTNETHLQTQLNALLKRCACSKEEKGTCESRFFSFPSNATKSALIYSRGCGSVIYHDIMHDLNVFKSLVPVSFTLVLVACLVCVIVTLLVANLEMGDEEVAMRSNGNAIAPSQPSSIHAGLDVTPASTLNRKVNPTTPNRLSEVAGPALLTLSTRDS